MKRPSKKSFKAQWRNDAELFDLIRAELYTPVVGDILDALGKYHQFLPQPVQPMRESMILAGRAMPVLMIDVHGPQKKPFGLLTEALDDLKPGEVYITGGGDMRCAYWGELLTATARTRGAVGAVVSRRTPPCARRWPISAARLKSAACGFSRAIWSSAIWTVWSSCRAQLKWKSSPARWKKLAAKKSSAKPSKAA
jgi:hypothetical protein